MKKRIMTGSLIKAWAKKPDNKEKAKALGIRLFKHQNEPEGLNKLPSLGSFEDDAQAWAIKNPNKAKMLMIQLAPLFMGS